MQRHNDRGKRWGRWEYQHFPQTYYKNYEEKQYATKITIYSLIMRRKMNFQGLRHFWQRQQTRHNSWTLHLRGCEYYKRLAFTWTLLMNMVNTTPFEGTNSVNRGLWLLFAPGAPKWINPAMLLMLRFGVVNLYKLKKIYIFCCVYL